MERIIQFTLVILFTIHSSHGRCPQATFPFNNGTKPAWYNFIESSVGNIGSLETCPYTGRPYVYLPCSPNSSWGSEPYFSNCTNPSDSKQLKNSIVLNDNNPYNNLTLEQVAKLPMTSPQDLFSVLSHLNEETTYFNSSDDIISAVNIIAHVIAKNKNANVIQSNLYSIANRLLSLESTTQIQEAQKINRSIIQLLSLLEKCSQNLMFDELQKSFSRSNVAVTIVNRPHSWTKPIIGFAFDHIKNDTRPITFQDNQQNATVIILDTDTIMKQNRLIFSVYNLKPDVFDDKQYRLLTPIVSITAAKPDLIKYSESHATIKFFAENNFKEGNVKLICAYWNVSDNMTEQWSTKECSLTNITQESVTCVCNHWGHFAVLSDTQQPLPVIPLAGIFLSSIGLCSTILTFILLKKLRRHFSQRPLFCLSINLLCVNFLFSIICVFTLSQLTELLCTIIGSLLHYFIMSSFCWMTVLAFIQYLLFVQSSPYSIVGFTRKAAVFAQVISLMPVTTGLLFDPFGYTKRKDDICWLSDAPFLLSFILPIALCFLINGIIYVIVAYSLSCGETAPKMHSIQIIESHRLSRFLLGVACFIVLNLTWVFGLFAVGSKQSLFQILFCIFAILTATVLFILYLVTSKTKRTCWTNNFKTLGISTIYSPTSSSSSGFLSNKEFSTTSVNDHLKYSSRHSQYQSKSQHFIDAYMPSSPPPPAPPIVAPPPPPPLSVDGGDKLSTSTITNHFYESRHVWAPETSYIYETNPLTTSLDDYSLFYSSNHDATKL